MAKSSSFFGLRKGSTKSHTYQVYRGMQITKDRVIDVANPQSTLQMEQRLKLPLVANATRVLQDIINHSFEGVAYGRDSIAEFRKLNLEKGKLEVECYVPKGVSDTGNATFQVSKGSLEPAQELTMTETEWRGSQAGVESSLQFTTYGLNAELTLADAKDGDEVPETVYNRIVELLGIPEGGLATFLLNYKGHTFTFSTGENDSNTSYYHRWVVGRFFADFAKQTTKWTYLNEVVAGDTSVYITNGYVDLFVDNINEGEYIYIRPHGTEELLCSGTVIFSQEVNGSWLRSTANMVTGEYAPQHGGSFQDVEITYLKNTTISDRYLNGGSETVTVTGD